jgi:DNA-binding MarR family transcriptional regulator
MSEAAGQAPVSPGFLLWHATLRWQRLIAAALRPLELTHVQFVLLAVLWWFTEVRGERPTQRALADQAGTDPMMTSQVLRTLEGRGLLERPQHPSDARARELRLTPAGAELAVRAIEVVEGVDRAFFEAVPDSSRLDQTLRALAGLEAERPLPRRVSQAAPESGRSP